MGCRNAASPAGIRRVVRRQGILGLGDSTMNAQIFLVEVKASIVPNGGMVNVHRLDCIETLPGHPAQDDVRPGEIVLEVAQDSVRL